MNITFRHPSGVFETVPGVGVTVGVQFAPGLGEIAPANYTVPSGYTPVQTTIASGSPASVLGGTGGYYLRFYNGLTQTLILPKFKMNDAAALNAARVTITTALAADETGITIDATGNLYTGS